ncbi:hypothetical protein BLNAU_14796 [Blattamonas nauphoetae]|uniref:Uncharacterized protein n=1 Tax=Blattamonas nauphoetae TaxID=2049346 RepID=A0ABQ9XHI6_9EUKA|nr:hypothetical protein BLNAU_14796 [Blattamonas nauphoetae]
MVLNDMAEVAFELMHARGRGPETITHDTDELEKVAANARNCIGIDWERWIREDTLGKSHGTGEQQTNELRRRMVENGILQALKEGLSLQLRIAWVTGSWDQVTYFQNELTSIRRITELVNEIVTAIIEIIDIDHLTTELERFDIDIVAPTIEDLPIDNVTAAIKNILNINSSFLSLSC